MSELDQKYAMLVDDMAQLNAKFKTFINGGENEVIPTDNGAIKSIAGIKKDLEQITYIQKLTNHRLYSDMVTAGVANGELVRVWGDTDLINGIYKKNLIDEIVKINYADIYDLSEPVSSGLTIALDDIQFFEDKDVMYYTIPIVDGEVVDGLISGVLKATSTTFGYRGSYSTDFKIHVAGADNNINFSVSTFNTTSIPIDEGFNAAYKPDIYFNNISTETEYKYKLKISAFGNMNGDIINSRLDINLSQVDADRCQIL